MSEGFTRILAPVYSKTLVDEQGKPLLIRMAPLVMDPVCAKSARVYFLARTTTDASG